MSLQLRQHAETAQAREGHSSDYSVSRAAAHTPDVLQETFRVENVEGRVVLDILRHVLTACNLSSFSLVDCCQSLLGRRLEVLPPSATAHLATDKSTSEIPICLEWTWLACWPCIWHALFCLQPGQLYHDGLWPVLAAREVSQSPTSRQHTMACPGHLCRVYP